MRQNDRSWAGAPKRHTSGALAGGQIGYLFQAGRAIIGFEVAGDWTDIKGSEDLGRAVLSHRF